jgi:hypothetical protein
VFQHENEARHPNDRTSNAHKLNVIRSIWRTGATLSYEIDLVTADPEVAYAREAALIATFRRLHEGGPLTNLAPGGGSTAGPAPLTKEKHRATLAGAPKDNPERSVLNRFVLSIAEMNSVVVKPRSQFIPRPTLRFPRSTRSFSMRQAVALAASAAANGIPMDGPCRLPRSLTVENVYGLVENGVACDLVTSNSVELVEALDPADECFGLNARQAHAVVGMLGRRKCTDLGIISS